MSALPDGTRNAANILNPSFGLEEGKQLIKDTIDNGYISTGNWLLDKLGVKYKYDEAKDFTIDTGKKILGAAANADIPGISHAAKFLGGGPSIIDEIKNWFNDTQFWQRAALIILALILLAGALYFLGSSKYTQMVKGVE